MIGHSKGGGLIMQFGDAMPHRVSHLVNLDGLPQFAKPDEAAIHIEIEDNPVDRVELVPSNTINARPADTVRFTARLMTDSDTPLPDARVHYAIASRGISTRWPTRGETHRPGRGPPTRAASRCPPRSSVSSRRPQAASLKRQSA